MSGQLLSDAAGKPSQVEQDDSLKNLKLLIESISSETQGTNAKKKLEELRSVISPLLKPGGELADLLQNGQNFLAFPIDVDSVLQHLNQDMRDDWFTDTLQHKDLLSNKKSLNDVLLELLSEGNGQYIGSLRNVYNIPKKGLGIRYSLETDFYDRFVYQAICTFLIPFYDPLLSHRVLSHRFNKDRKSEKYIFKSRIELWQTFEGVTKTALSNEQSLLATDLINCYENITIETIRTAFERSIEHINTSGPNKVLIRNAVQTLCNLLSRWGYSERHGLPQNRDASSFIANVVLNDIDHEMVRQGYDYYRYVDDIRVICPNTRVAKRALTELINQLRNVGMNINSGKTKILTKGSTPNEIDEFFPTSDDRSITIDNMWRSRSRRVIARSAKYIFQILKDCIEKKQTQSRQFRFAVNRLIKLTDAGIFDVHATIAKDLKALLINSLEDHAASTDQYCRLLGILDLNEQEHNELCDHLSDHERSIHSWQNFHLWLLLANRKYKSANLIALATARIDSNILQPEVAAIFIYLKCVDEVQILINSIARFEPTWPYYHQRNFLLACSDLDPTQLKPLISKLGPKLKWTGGRAKPYFTNGMPLVEREKISMLDLYDEITPYD
ncbi:group II intron reverse transcriptase/maturase [compost metagenome]